MKTLNTQNTLVAIIVGAPLLILGGCASTDPIKLAPDAFTQMDASHDEGIVKLQTQEMNEQMASEYAEQEYEAPETLDGVVTQSSVSENPMSENPVSENSASETNKDGVVNIAEQAEFKMPATPKPDSGLISFAFDQSIIDAQYGELLWQHAQYLKENKNLVLLVSGHTDSSGAKKYNDMLSKKRAKQVASILIEFGVPAERIKVSGNGSDQPLAGALTHRDNRRVELEFQDQQIVSNE